MSKEHLPTVNYLDWLDAYQAQVAEMQKEISAMDRYFQRPYRDITELFRTLKLNSDIDISMSKYGVSVRWHGITDDCRADLEGVRSRITAALNALGMLRPGSNGSTTEGYTWQARWRLFDGDREVGSVTLTYCLPTEGNRDMVREAQLVERKYQDTVYQIVERPKRLLGWKEAEALAEPADDYPF